MKETQRSDPFDFNGTLCVPRDNLGQLTVDRSILGKLLHHAASAAQLVGHLDDNAQPELIRQIGDRVDTVAHELAEILGAPSALAAPDAAAPDDREAPHGAPMLTSIAGGAP
jgi:hypothetical protein